MLRYADTFLRPGQEISANICIIGSGAAGISLANRLVDRGRNGIVVLEGSRLSNPGWFTDTHREILQRYGAYPPEAIAALPAVPQEVSCTTRGHRFWDPSAQELYEGKESDVLRAMDPEFLSCSRLRVYGGTTNCWGGWTVPLRAIDFDRSDLDASDRWPIERTAIFPGYYKMAMDYCSLSPLGPDRYENPKSWIGQTTKPVEVMPLESVAKGQLQSSVFTGMDSTQWNFQQVWGRYLENAPPEVCLILRNANVRALDSGAGGSSIAGLRASTVDYSGSAPLPGFDFRVKANVYILATGGSEGPRLLLHSGVANRYDTLGRYFMFHPLNTNAASFSGGRAPSEGIYNFYSSWPKATGTFYPPTVWLSITPTDATMRSLKLRNFRAIIGFDGHWRIGGGINLNWEQAPNSRSRITLDGGPDPIFGDPLPYLDWQYEPEDLGKTPKTALELVTGALGELGYLTGWEPNPPPMTWSGDHHMGATRMSSRPEDGYVNADCRAHEVDNLFIASSSVFTTGGYANPTLTIVALALRLADRLGAGATDG